MRVRQIIRKNINLLFEDDIKTQKGTPVKRSAKYGVGKYIGGSIYIHRMYEDVLPQKELAFAKKQIGDWDYQIVKYNEKSKKFSFIKSSDFNTSEEPTVENYVIVYPDGKTVYKKTSGNQIYHHKWLFVKDNYPGFNVEQEKDRSRVWLSFPDIDFSRIGNRKYWEDNFEARLKE